MNMEKPNSLSLAKVAESSSSTPFHGFLENSESNIKPIIELFPKWNLYDADNKWCAAFVYYCCIKAGFDIPYSPSECETCSLAGCGGWEEFAIKNEQISYYPRTKEFVPEVGDIVLFDNVYENKEHDHIGIVIEVNKDYLLVAEGNIPGTNTSGIVKRKRDNHIRAYIRIPNEYKYKG